MLGWRLRDGVFCCSNWSPWGERWVVGRYLAVLRRHIPWITWGGVELLHWCPAWFLRGTWAVETFLDLSSGALVKRKVLKNGQPSTRAAIDPALEETSPLLYDHLTALCFDDDPNDRRQTSTLLIFAGDGVWKACLRDRAEALCLWVASPSLLGLLDVLEAELGSAGAVWRMDRLSGAEESTRRPIRKSPGQRSSG